MPSAHHNYEVAKNMEYHMFTAHVHTRLSLVILLWITRLPLLLRKIRGWADRPAIVSRNTEFIRPRIRRAETNLAFPS